MFVNQSQKINIYPVKPHLSLYKMGFSRVFITLSCYRNEPVFDFNTNVNVSVFAAIILRFAHERQF